jgi:filamentous hemagglutinin family protein
MNTTMHEQRAVQGTASLRRRLLPLLIAGCFAGNAIANPLGPQVVNGQAGFINQGNTLSVTNTPGAIINWQSFSINPGELTRFIQQNPNSAVLNRIVGGDPSQILGALQSNGKVFLINPNGILFGQGAQVDVNGLVASSLNISNEDFLTGRLNFKAGDRTAAVRNQGVITTPSGGQVYLIAPNVENSGIITSPKGDVVLAAGHSVQLVDSANPDLHVVVSAPDNEALNLGQIVAHSGKVGIYGALVKQRGIVNANSAVVGENGKIVFKASGDTILDAGSKTTATGAGKGGDIHLLGERVGLNGDARVDASGQYGGGTILVGGDYHGSNPEMPNATRAYVGPDAELRADAIQGGDGGKVIVWSDEVTRDYGRISAHGGAQGGNGGFVESSGKQYLDHRAKVDVGAPMGQGGTLLLDPATITLVGGAGDGAASPDGNLTFQGSATPGTVNFADSDITTAGISNIYQSELGGLTPGTNIILEATDYISTTGSFGNQVLLPMNSNLTMRTRNASGDGTVVKGINLIGSTDTMNLEFKTQGTGTITLQTGTGASPQFATINVGKLTTGGGQVVVSASGDVVLRSVTTTPGAPGNGGNISVTSGGYMTFGGDMDARGNSSPAGDVTFTSGGAINAQFSNALYANQFKATAVGGITNGAGSPIPTQVNFLNAINSGGGDIKIGNSVHNLSITDIGATGYGVRQVNGGNVVITNASGNTIGINNKVVTNGGNVDITGPAGIWMIAAEPISTSGGYVALAATDLNAQINMPASSQITSGGGVVKLSADNMSFTGSSINAGAGSVSLSPNSVATAIELGQTSTDAAGILALDENELKTITTSSLMTIGGNTMTGNMALMGVLNLTAGSLTGTLLLNAGSGNIAVNDQLHAPAALVLKTTGGTISQALNKIISATSLKAAGGTVTLDQAANPVGVIAGSSTSGDFRYRTANLLTVSTVDSYSGINAGANKILLQSDHAAGINQSLGAAIVTTGGLAVKAIGPVMLTDSSNAISAIAADMTGTGNFALYSSSALNIDTLFAIPGITTTGKVVLLAGNNVTQSAPITASDLAILSTVGSSVALNNSSNQVGTLAAATNGGPLSFTNATALTVGAVTDGTHTAAGITTGTGAVSVDTITGNLAVASPINAGTGAVSLTATAGALAGGSVNGASLVANASGGITLTTQVGTLSAANSGANTPITISNTGALHVPRLTQPATSTGGITVVNTGALTVDVGDGTAVSSDAGAISLIAHSPLTVVGSVASTSGAITLEAGASGNSPNDQLNINVGASVITSGAILLKAGDAITIAPGTVSGTPTKMSNLNTPPPSASPPPPPPPSIDQCVASPTLSGCTAVLPTLSACVTAPATAGCTAVLPTLSACVTDPTAAGCATVLPTLSACVTAPTTAGCTAVLPTLSACVTAPTTAGCTAVLPTLSACVTAPANAGCTMVLPPMSVCVTAPATAGCTAVLPPLSACVTAPATAGCTAVLPTLSACVTAPATAGCAAVLPSLSACVTAPTTAGCSAVVPTLGQCVSTPTLAGCTVVLPTLNQCTASPTLAGCSAVLPSVSQCVAAPTSAGCAVVVPTAQTPANAPVNQVLNTTINTINTSTATVTNVTTAGKDAGAGSGNKTSDSAKKDDKKDDKKDTAGSDKTGAKNDDVAKKMYCN